MGIPYYFYLLTKTHPDILARVPPPGIARFYLDFNGAVYNAFYGDPSLAAPGAPDVHARLCRATWAYFQHLRATLLPAGDAAQVRICMDGVAPVAKMMQQRKRRFMTMAREQLLAAAPAAPWDTNAISPGTAFMAELTAFMAAHCAGAAAFSGPDEPGEGEHKIFAHLAAHPVPPGGGATVVYGLDADLIMLALLSNQPRLFLMREEQPRDKKKQQPGPLPFVYLDVDALRRGLLQQLAAAWPGAQDDDQAVAGGAQACIERYIVLCFLLGNDFLPPLPALHMREGHGQSRSGMDTVLAAYQATRRATGEHILEANKNNTINYRFVLALLERLASDEDARVFEDVKAYLHRRSHAATPDDKVEFHPLEHKDPVAHAVYSARGPEWRAVYYAGLFHGVDPDAACRDYLTGLAWTWQYYRQRPKDGRWAYQPGFAPSARDLAACLRRQLPAFERLAADWAVAGADADAFVAAPVQLLSILPAKSVELLPPALRPLMREPRLGLAHLYPRAFALHTYVKTRLWECHPVLPPLDIAWVEECLAAHVTG